MAWREIFQQALSYPAPVYHLHPVAGSVLFYMVTFLMTVSLMKISRRVSPQPFQEYIADFVSTFHVCACSFENGNLMRVYGWLGLYAVVFTLMMIYSNIFDDCCPSPVGNIKMLFQRRQTLVKTLVKVMLQAAAGACSFHYVRQFWRLDFHEYHSLRTNQTHCLSFLTVGVVLGFLIEGGATVIDILLCAYHLVPWKQLNNIMRCSLETALVIAGLSLTGMYFNPAMASAQTYGCRGTQVWEHLVVYWGGPTLGCFVGVKVNSAVRGAIKLDTARPGKVKSNGQSGVGVTGNGKVKSQGDGVVRKRSAKMSNNNNNDSEKKTRTKQK